MSTQTAGPRQILRPALVVGALGVVFGDIGTSPIYALQTVFSPTDPHPVPPTRDNIFGVVSLIIWSVTLIVTVTYVLLAMRVDNDGEGGIMALITLLRRWAVRHRSQAAAVLAALGLLGAALFLGDSMITPAISVLSAVEGLKVVDQSLEHLVIPITVVIIIALFLVQRFGTSAVGKFFGPVMIVGSPRWQRAASGGRPGPGDPARRSRRSTPSTSSSDISTSRSSRWARGAGRHRGGGPVRRHGPLRPGPSRWRGSSWCSRPVG